MTIEEMIERLKNDAKESRKAALSCARANDYETASRWKTLGYLHEQIAEWLIELKRRREAEITTPPKTNGDCIRNMTDDEELLIAIGIGCYRCAYINGECDRGYGKRCIDGNLEWLKQEVSEDAGTDD